MTNHAKRMFIFQPHNLCKIPDVVKLLNIGASPKEITKLTGVKHNTIYRIRTCWHLGIIDKILRQHSMQV